MRRDGFSGFDREVFFSSKRQQYLVDQGYTFNVRQDLAEFAEQSKRTLSTKTQELDLLAKTLEFNVSSVDNVEERAVKRASSGEVEELLDDGRSVVSAATSFAMVRKVGNLSSYSGAP